MTVACPEGLPSLHAPAAPEHAARLLGTAAALRERIGVPLPRRERPRREKLLAALHTALGDDGVASAEAMGRTTPLQTATAEMLDELPSNGSVAPEPERVSAERAE